MKVQELTVVNCYHCGDPCAEEQRVHDGHDFCCHGCETVYDLLNESGLCDYYSISDRPGVKERTAIDEPRTELFDLEEVRARLVEFDEGGITRVRFHVPQMHCSSCVWLLENLPRLDRSIMRSRVAFADKKLTVTFREEQLSWISRALAQRGLTVDYVLDILSWHEAHHQGQAHLTFNLYKAQG